MDRHGATFVDWSGSYPYGDDDPYYRDPPEVEPPVEPVSEPGEEAPKEPPANAPSGPAGRGAGLVCGRFLPPHRGHLHYVELAASFCAELTVLLVSYEDDPISGELRQAWLEELFPRARVVHARHVKAPPREAPDFWAQWAAILRQHVPSPELFFTGDARAAHIARHLGAKHVLVDPQRIGIPIAATAIRENPLAHFEELPPCVRPHYVKRVAFLGAESSGKSTLARALSRSYGTVLVPDYARIVSEAKRAAFTYDEVDHIARCQRGAQASLARHANRVLFSDGDLRALFLWSERRFDRTPAWIRAEASATRWDLTLVPAPDTPFVGRPEWDVPAMRAAFHTRALALAHETSQRVVVLSGSWEERETQARRAIDALLSLPPP